MGGIYGLRKRAGYKWFVEQNRKWILPTLAGVFAVWLIVGCASHFVFTAFESAGCVCRPQLETLQSVPLIALLKKKIWPTTQSQTGLDQQINSQPLFGLLKQKFSEKENLGETLPSVGSAPLIFNAKNICWASGYRLEEGKRYKLTLTKTGAEWKDNEIKPPSIGEFEVKDDSVPWSSKLVFYGAFWLRRNLSESWFTPMARIGHTGHDEYPLHAVGSSTAEKLVAEITARRSGELYLFLNDTTLPLPTFGGQNGVDLEQAGALPFPASWQPFYGNNHATATIEIQRLDEAGK